jgi:fatty acid desaturase
VEPEINFAKDLPRRARIEWPTVALAGACYALWFAAGLWLWPVAPVAALAVMAVMVALHSSLQHEALHGHPTRDARVNEALVFLPLGLFYPYRRFKALHLAHHHDERLTDPYDDPESYYRAEGEHAAYPAWFKAVLRANNAMAGRFLLGPALMVSGFKRGEFDRIVAGDRAVRIAWLLHGAGVCAVFAIVWFGFGINPLLYAATAAYFGLALITIRTYAEHRWQEKTDGRSIIVEKSILSLLFLNNNLHFVHHRLPTVAWYRLPALYRARRAEWIAANGGYVLPNYTAMAKAYLFTAKEPVVHPALRRLGSAAAAFAPRMRARNVAGGGALPVPAEPARD